MTGADLKALLRAARVSQACAARELGVDARTMRRWCAAGLVPRLVEIATRAVWYAPLIIAPPHSRSMMDAEDDGLA